MNKKLENSLDNLASIQVTLFCLGLMMLLIFFGTMAQAKLGTFAAQKIYFNSFWIKTDLGGFQIPLFPGGLLVGGIWLLNLLAAFAVKFRYKKKDAGLLLSHFGLILLVAGQGLTQLTAHESRLALQEGQTGQYVERASDPELVFTMTSDPNADQVVSLPYSLFSRKKEIETALLPFTVRIREFFPNADLKMRDNSSFPRKRESSVSNDTRSSMKTFEDDGIARKSLATQGIGPQIAVTEIPVTHKDDEMNNVSAYVEVLEGDKSLGVWLASMALGAPQGFSSGGKEYRLAIRARREYLPYQITLKDFRHDIYPGTDIPKNFSSLVHLRSLQKNEDRDVLIYMNNPLRFEGKTFYQASFGENDTLSIFQVVENPVWLTPYISCALVVLGLGIQFIGHLRKFLKKPQ